MGRRTIRCDRPNLLTDGDPNEFNDLRDLWRGDDDDEENGRRANQDWRKVLSLRRCIGPLLAVEKIFEHFDAELPSFAVPVLPIPDVLSSTRMNF